MPISQEELVAELATVELYGGDLSVTFRLNEDATPEESAAIMDVTEGGYAEAGMRSLCKVLARTVSTWDLLDKPESEGGVPVELSEDALYSGVRSGVLLKVFEAINEARSLGEVEGRGSERPSGTPSSAQSGHRPHSPGSRTTSRRPGTRRGR